MNPDMRQAMLAVVRRIPAGRVASYGQVAALAGYPRRARLAGRALQGADDGVPWHRVLNAAGRSSLPADSAAGRRQRERLQAEGVEFRGGRVDLRRFGWQPTSRAPVLD